MASPRPRRRHRPGRRRPDRLVGRPAGRRRPQRRGQVDPAGACSPAPGRPTPGRSPSPRRRHRRPARPGARASHRRDRPRPARPAHRRGRGARPSSRRPPRRWPPATPGPTTATPPPSSAGWPSGPPTSTPARRRWRPTSASPDAVLDQPTATLSGGQAARARAGRGPADPGRRPPARRAHQRPRLRRAGPAGGASCDRLPGVARGRVPRPGLPRAHRHRRARARRAQPHRRAPSPAAGWRTSTSGPRPGATPRRPTAATARRDDLHGPGPADPGVGGRGRRQGGEEPAARTTSSSRHHNIAEQREAGRQGGPARQGARAAGGRGQAVGGLGAAARPGHGRAQRRRGGPARPMRWWGGATFRLGTGRPRGALGRSGRRWAGPNGSGKTTLIDALLGRVPLVSGERWVGPRCGGRRAGPGPRPVRRGRPVLDGAAWPTTGVVAVRGPVAAGQVRARRRPRVAAGRRAVAGGADPGRAGAAHGRRAPTAWCSTSRPTTSTCRPSSSSSRPSRTWAGTLLLVTHDRRFLDAVTTEGTRHLRVEAGRVTET